MDGTMVSRGIACAAIAVLAVSMGSAVSASEMADLGEPAMLTVTAERATVLSQDGKAVLQLSDVHPLVVITAALHKDRYFDAYPITDFASSYNSCNVLKGHSNLWHQDGANSLLVFERGPAASEHAGFRQYSPLITAPHADDAARITDREQGTAPIFIETAEYNAATGSMSFLLADASLISGNYENVVLNLECAANSL